MRCFLLKWCNHHIAVEFDGSSWLPTWLKYEIPKGLVKRISMFLWWRYNWQLGHEGFFLINWWIFQWMHNITALLKLVKVRGRGLVRGRTTLRGSWAYYNLVLSLLAFPLSFVISMVWTVMLCHAFLTMMSKLSWRWSRISLPFLTLFLFGHGDKTKNECKDVYLPHGSEGTRLESWKTYSHNTVPVHPPLEITAHLLHVII